MNTGKMPARLRACRPKHEEVTHAPAATAEEANASVDVNAGYTTEAPEALDTVPCAPPSHVFAECACGAVYTPGTYEALRLVYQDISRGETQGESRVCERCGSAIDVTKGGA